MSLARTLVISYGNWSSSDSGWHLCGVHELDTSSPAFSVTFDVLLIGSSVADFKAKHDAFQSAIDLEHRRVVVSYGGTSVTDLDPGTTSWTAQSSAARAKSLERWRSDVSRAYRVTIQGEQIRKAEKIGKRSQRFVISTSPEGVRQLEATITFTPDGSVGSADSVADDATYGFDATVDAFLTAIGGDWDDGSPAVRERDEDGRSCVVRATYQELIFAQSADATNDTTLTGVQFRVATVRAATTTIEALQGSSPAAIRVSFSSGVRKSQTQDLDTVIRSKVLPYIRSTLADYLGTDGGSLVEVRDSLEGDPMTNRIAGAVDFLATISGGIISATREISTDVDEGIELLEVEDGEDFTVDVHRSGKQASRTVRITSLEFGQLGARDEDYISATLAGLEQSTILEMEPEWLFLGVRHVSRDSQEALDSGVVETIASVSEMRFRRVVPKRTASQALNSVEGAG